MNPDPNVAYPPPTKKKGPNWFIILPCGCLSIIGLIVLVAGFGAYMLFQGLKDSEAFKESIAKVQASAKVQEALGTPIEQTMIVMGGVSTENGTERIVLGYPIKGPKGAGAVVVEASRPSGSTQWTYSKMEVTIGSSNQVINLLEEE